MSRPPRSLIFGLTLCSGSLLLLTSCKEEDPEEFGFACVDLVQADSQETDPFMGTAEIKVTLKYEPCLIEYYTMRHTEERLDSTDGPATFERWRERLCTEDVSSPLVACEIPDLSYFQQTLQDNGPASVYQMTITYKITDSSQINNRTLLWGPGPVADYAECQMDQQPFAKLTLPSDVIGLDKNGQTIWSTETWANPRGIMQRSSAGCIVADIKAGG